MSQPDSDPAAAGGDAAEALETPQTPEAPETTEAPEALDVPETPNAPETTEAPVPPTFAELGVIDETVAALAEDGIERTFPIQAQTLPLALEGADIIGQAKTGTGKTLAFGVPMIQRIAAPGEPDGTDGLPQGLIVVPTRELAIQVGKDVERAGRMRRIRVLTIYGGRAYEPQIDVLKAGVEVVVGTPGRLIDLVKQRHLNLSAVRILVLDEADEMLDMGFLPDVERIVAQVPAQRQTMLFSATMPGQIVALARRYMNRPMHLRAADVGDDSAIVDAIEQHVWRAHPMDKMEVIARVLQAEDRGLTMIFSRTKRRAQKIVDELTERGFAAAAVHGDLGQGAREQALRAFRNGKVDVLAATDVAARGIDVEGVTHVINYECPDDEKTYVHRIGRTGRAGQSGVAVTLVDWEDLARWAMIDRALRLPFANPLETYSTSDHIYNGLNIPRTAKGRLPRSARTRAGLAAEEIEDLGETGPAAGRGRSRRDSSHHSREPSPARHRAGDERTHRGRKRRRTGGNRPDSEGGSPEGTGTRPAAEAGVASSDTASAPQAGDAPARRPRQRRRRTGSPSTGNDGGQQAS